MGELRRRWTPGRRGPARAVRGAMLDRVRRCWWRCKPVAAELTRTVRARDAMRAAEHDGLKTMASWLRGHARLSPAAAARLVPRAGRWSTCRRSPAGFAAGAVTAGAGQRDRRGRRAEELPRPRRRASTWPRSTRRWRGRRQATARRSWRQVVRALPDALDPDGPEPDPTEGRRLTIARHADGRGAAGSTWTPVGGEKVAGGASSRSCRPTARRAMTGPGRSRTPTRWCSCATTSSPPAACRRCARSQAARHRHHRRRGPRSTPATGPGAARTGFGARISAARARWLACDGTISRIVMGPDGLPLDVGRTQRVVPAAHPPGRRAARRALRVRRLRRPHPLVRRPPSAALDRRRRDLAGELRAALRTAPHQGPPRVPDRTRSRRPMAHLPPRRHRDPPGAHRSAREQPCPAVR